MREKDAFFSAYFCGMHNVYKQADSVDIKTIKNNLSERHQAFTNFVDGLSREQFLASKPGKWTAGQQLEHILLAVKPVRLAFSLPKFLLKLIWGTSNRKGRTYEELVKRYAQKLEGGGKASGRFVPKAVPFEKGKGVSLALQQEVASLCTKIDRFTEEELEQYILPHPLLGKLTLREMLYFTIHHVEHHQTLTKRYLEP